MNDWLTLDKMYRFHREIIIILCHPPRLKLGPPTTTNNYLYKLNTTNCNDINTHRETERQEGCFHFRQVIRFIFRAKEWCMRKERNSLHSIRNCSNWVSLLFWNWQSMRKSTGRHSFIHSFSLSLTLKYIAQGLWTVPRVSLLLSTQVLHKHT